MLFTSGCREIHHDDPDGKRLFTEALNQIEFIDDNFILLKHRQGVFNMVATTEDSVELIFNRAVIGLHAKSLVNKYFDNDAFHSDSGSSQLVTGVWPYNRIGIYKVRELQDLLRTDNEDDITDNWISFKGLKSKKLIIISEPVYSREKDQALIGLQVFTDSLYYVNVVSFRKEQQWVVNSTFSSKLRLLEFNIENVEGIPVLTPVRAVILD